MASRLKVLIIGSGGREHALAWKLAASPRVSEVLVAPGNAGTAAEAGCRNLPLAADDVPGLVAMARREAVGLTVVGPETPLALGVVDAFQAEGLRIFGPSQAAAQLEASKAFSKDFLARHRIPTAGYRVFDRIEPALADIARRGAPIVVKADGLAAGKGVVVAQSVEEAQTAVRDMLGGALPGAAGAAGARVVIEDFLDGEEASFIVVASGTQYQVLPSSQDHKRIGEGDRGPNTGGMGAYSPAPVVSAEVHARVCREVIEPTLAGMAAEGRPFRGFLYAGLMIDGSGQAKVLEFNTRLGDPETQPLLFRLQSDLLDLLEAAIDDRLDTLVGARAPVWSPRPSLGVVLAAEGYPGRVRVGDVIEGLESDLAGSKVFHAGTALDEGRVVTAGGRVLCVVADGVDLAEARERAYARVQTLCWNGLQFRRDIGYRALAVGRVVGASGPAQG